MERLTTKNSMGVAVFKESYNCENCNESLWRLPDYGNGSPTDRLAQYEEAEEQGLILWLPIAIGDTVWTWEYPTRIDEEDGSTWIICDIKRATIVSKKFNLFMLDRFGETYFATKDEAEQALIKKQS